MLHFVFLSEFIKVFTPYIRKSLLFVLDPFECMFLNSMVVLTLCLLILFYKIVVEDHNPIITAKRYASMDLKQFLFALLIGIATIIASMIVLSFDKYYNTPLINSMLFKIVSVTLLLFTGVTFFNETYSYKQVLGCLFVIVGGVLIFHKETTVYFSQPY